MMSIVTTGPDTGYYADVFRSRKERGGDKMHDYFYHNLGQSMTLTAVDGTDMNLQPTEELAFAGADLYAYSYLYDNVNSKACISLRVHVNITRKEMLCKERSVLAEHFYWLGLGSFIIVSP